MKDETEISVLCLHECYDCTDMLGESCRGDLDTHADVECSCTVFCRNMVVPSRRVKTHPNFNLWVTKSVISSIQKRNSVSKHGTPSDLHYGMIYVVTNA